MAAVHLEHMLWAQKKKEKKKKKTLDGVGGQCHAQAALTPGKTTYPLCRNLGGPQGRSGRVQKISPPPVFDPRNYSDLRVGNE